MEACEEGRNVPDAIAAANNGELLWSSRRKYRPQLMCGDSQSRLL